MDDNFLERFRPIVAVGQGMGPVGSSHAFTVAPRLRGALRLRSAFGSARSFGNRRQRRPREGLNCRPKLAAKKLQNSFDQPLERCSLLREFISYSTLLCSTPTESRSNPHFYAI